MSQGPVLISPLTNHPQPLQPHLQAAAYAEAPRFAFAQGAPGQGGAGTQMMIQGHGFQSKRFRTMQAIQGHSEGPTSFILSDYQKLKKFFPLLDEKVSQQFR